MQRRKFVGRTVLEELVKVGVGLVLTTIEGAKTRFGVGCGDPSWNRAYNARVSHPPRLRAVLDRRIQPRRMSVVKPTNFDVHQDLADCFKRGQPVILNLQQADSELSQRLVDFCAGLAYALDGQIQTVADRLFLLTPHDAEVWTKESGRFAERASWGSEFDADREMVSRLRPLPRSATLLGGIRIKRGPSPQ